MTVDSTSIPKYRRNRARVSLRPKPSVPSVNRPPGTHGGLFTLGTDGFGRSDTCARLRRYFGIDVESTVIGTLYALAEKKMIDKKVVAQAIKDFGVDPEMVQPQIV